MGKVALKDRILPSGTLRGPFRQFALNPIDSQAALLEMLSHSGFPLCIKCATITPQSKSPCRIYG